ncbi:hypothetical protein ACLOJK_015356 [Asimina triloba]
MDVREQSRDAPEWAAQSQMRFGKDNRIPRLFSIMEEENPEPIVGDEKFPGLAYKAHPGRFLGFQILENLKEDICGQLIEGAGGRLVEYVGIPGRFLKGKEIGIGSGGGHGNPDFLEQHGHGDLIRDESRRGGGIWERGIRSGR